MMLDHDAAAPYAERIALLSDLVVEPARRVLFTRAMQRVDWSRLEAIRRAHLPGPLHMTKYLDVPYWTWVRLDMVDKLALDARGPLRILDIGCGCAHFGVLASVLGHTYVGTDIANPLYVEVCKALSIETRIEHRVESGQPLPDFGGPFDIVTAFDTWFHAVPRAGASGKLDWWGPADWTWFLFELSKQMSPHARVLFTPNKHVRDDGTHWHDPVIYDHFARLGSKPLVQNASHMLDLTRADLLAAVAAQ